ncbi:MAG TPA: AtpZ/AtpI family protein [bacterium]|nr:AtpZ/AtpI family protein [bacterium]
MASGKTPRFQWKKEYSELLSYSSVGIEMGAAVGIGILIGWLIDAKVFDNRTFPWLTLVFFGLGIVAAGNALYHAIKEMKAKQDAMTREQDMTRERDKKEDGPRQQ